MPLASILCLYQKHHTHLGPRNGPVIQASLGVWPAPLHLPPLPGCDTGDWCLGSEAGFVGTLALPTPWSPAWPLTLLSRSLQLMEALKEQEEINFRMRQYMDKIILAILDHNPSILEIKH